MIASPETLGGVKSSLFLSEQNHLFPIAISELNHLFLSFIETAMRIVGHHGMAGFRADTVAFRNKQCLVIVTAKGGRFFFLPDGSLAAALTPGTNLQRDSRRIICTIHDQRNIATARTASAGQCLHLKMCESSLFTRGFTHFGSFRGKRKASEPKLRCLHILLFHFAPLIL